VTNVQAQALAVNWIHHGGKGAFTRILAKTPKPYTLDNFYNASKSDTGNQVGAYRTRQTACYNMIKQYMPVEQPTEHYEIAPGTTAEDILNIMRGWIGLSRSNLTHKVIIDTYNSYLPHPRGYAVTYTDDYCATGFCAAFVLANSVDLIGGIECSVERLIEDCFKKADIWIESDDIVPLPGDAICFYWNESRKEVDNTGWGSHIGIVEYVENGIIHTIECNSTGGAVLRRTYEIGQACIRGFARPKYGINSSTVKVKEPVVVDIQTPLKKGSYGDDVKKMQIMLIALGYDCAGYGADGDFGNGTEASLKLFQKQHGLEETGVYTVADKS